MNYYNPNKKPNNHKKRKPVTPHYKTIKTYKSEKKKKEKKIKINFKLIAVLLAAAAISVLLAVIIPSSAKAQTVEGYEVYLCGKPLGIVENPDEIDAYLEDVRSQFSAAFGMSVTDELEVEYEAVCTKVDYICPADLINNIIGESIDVKVLAAVIYINDWPAAVLQTVEEAQWVLDEALLPYETPSDGSLYGDICFVEDVRIEECGADFIDIITKEEALHNLTIGPGVELEYHVVVTGDSLSRIAKKYDIKISDIMISNPDVSDADTIYPGDKLLVVTPKNSLSIKYTEVVDRIQDMDYDTVYIDDDSMYTTEKEVVTEGVMGQSQVQAEITYINGIEVEFNLLDEDPITLPVNEVIRRGTIEVPTELTLASEGDVPLPLKSGTYTITSKFGYRDTGIEGASTYHKGVDLGADEGTPVYASLDGTVYFAGSGTGYGLYIRIKHDGGVETRYAHCSQLLVSKGDYVEQGDLIALVGSTGVSSGPHLHFEVRIDGEAVDPLNGE